MFCSVCEKAINGQYLTDDTGNFFCTEACFDSNLPGCVSCGKAMHQWVTSQETGNKYCSEACFKDECPKCVSCGKSMDSWIESEDREKFCSEKCHESVLPQCSACKKPMKSWQVSESSGEKYCSEECFQNEFPNCDDCGKPMREWVESNESGKKYCNNDCFKVEWPICVSCSKPMNEWIVSKESGHQYCCETCFQVELPSCDACGEKMHQWHIVGEHRFCSTTCVATTYPLCETCMSPISEWIEGGNGLKYCSSRCQDTDDKCNEVAKQQIKNSSKMAETIGIVTAVKDVSKRYAEQVLFRSGERTTASGQTINTGHGVAAERVNDLKDQANFRKVEPNIGDKNVKNGPDRIVDGEQIQTKYWESGEKCIDACFNKKGEFKYLDGNENPMQVEVPSDKYEAALRRMEQKISEGKVKGVTDPAQAKEIVREGQFSYATAKNIARFGTIESLTYDSIRGVQAAATSGGITVLLSFSFAVWNGEDVEEAGKHALISGMKVGGIAFITQVAVSQVSRLGFDKCLIGTTESAVKFLSPQICSMIAKGLGKNALKGAAASKYVAKVLRGNVVTAVVVTVILSAKDVFRFLDGRVSFGQAFKSISTTGASITGGILGGEAGASCGAVMGGSIGSVIPIVGTAVGAVVGGFIGFICGGAAGGAAAGATTKAALGVIIEDDSAALGREFQAVSAELAQAFMLQEKEIEILSNKIQSLDLESFLREMYADNNRRSLVASVVKPILVEIVASRPSVPPLTPEILMNSFDACFPEEEMALVG